MILVAADLAQLEGWVRLQACPTRQRAVLASWPGANTWILPAGPRPALGHRRAQRHRGAHQRAPAGGRCAAPGAARWSPPAPTWPANHRHAAGELDPRLLRLLDGILDGETGGLAQPTPIRDALSGNVLRS
jgi:L-threonylcarbamoyladenylate synthase